MKKLAYLKETEATEEIDAARQQLKSYGYDRLYVDARDNNITRPRLKELMDHLSNGDTLVIYSLANATRNLAQMIHLLATTHDRDIRLVSTGDHIDTDDPVSRQWRMRLGSYLVDQRSGDRAAKRAYSSSSHRSVQTFSSKEVRDQHIIDLYHSRYRIPDICAKMGLSKQQVFRILKKHDVVCDRLHKPQAMPLPDESEA